MSKFWKVFLLVIVVVALAVVWSNKSAVSPVGDAANSTSVADPVAEITVRDSSDTSLDQDLSSIDNSLGNLSQDIQSVDQGLNDQMVLQAQ